MNIWMPIHWMTEHLNISHRCVGVQQVAVIAATAQVLKEQKPTPV